MLNFCSKLLSGLFTLPGNASHKRRRHNALKVASPTLSTQSSSATLLDEYDAGDSKTLNEANYRGLKRSGSHLSLSSSDRHPHNSQTEPASQASDGRRKRQRRLETHELGNEGPSQSVPADATLGAVPAISPHSHPALSSCRNASPVSPHQSSLSSENEIEELTRSTHVSPAPLPSLGNVSVTPVTSLLLSESPSTRSARESKSTPPETSPRLSHPSPSYKAHKTVENIVHPPSASPPAHISGAVPNAIIGQSDEDSASYEQSYVGEDEWSKSPSPPLSSRSAPVGGEATRVEITFEKFSDELLRSQAHHEQIDTVAGEVVGTPRWTSLVDAYIAVARQRSLTAHSGDRKNRFLDIMNLVVDECRSHGLDMPERHHIRFERFHYDGTQMDAPPPPDQEPWQNDSRSPCAGIIEPMHEDIKSAWRRTIVLVDVYNPRNQASPMESPLSSLKHELEDGAPESPRPIKRRRIKGIDEDDSQPFPRLSWVELERDYYAVRKSDDGLLDSASRLFRATGNRRHVLGIFVNRMSVRFYFMDHAGTVYSSPLDLRRDAQHIVSAILSISLLDAFQLGLEPYIAAGTPITPTDLLQQRDNLHFDVDGTRFHAQTLIHADNLFGRGTVVYEATPLPTQERNEDESMPDDIPRDDVVLKLSWQMPSTHSEDELMRLAYERGVKGVTRLYRSAVVARLSDGPRGRLVPSYMYADRELRVQVMGPRAMPLYLVKDLETFKIAFRSLVVDLPSLTAHHNLYVKAGILHRDISYNNLMVNRANHCEGVLIDFDLAARVDECGHPLDSAELPPAGTLPFRATDLIRPERPTKAYYRHDLESFFYVLLWMQTNYQDGVHYAHPEGDQVYFDFDSAWGATKNLKLGFLAGYDDPDPLPQTSLRHHWLAPLHYLFGSAKKEFGLSIAEARAGRGSALDEVSYGGRISFDSFYNIVRS